VERIAAAAASTRTPSVIGGVGGFASLFRFDPKAYPSPILVSSTDGVGTKLKVAIALGRFDTIGVDLVNACVNDIVVSGADPLFFLDYVGLGELRIEIVDQIVGSVANGCAAAGIPLVGGETAQMPDLYRNGDLDLVGFVVGVVARRDVLDGARVREGDAILGLPSTGLHTNGYTLARRVLTESSWADPMPDDGATIGDALLAPHRSYLDEVRILRRALRAVRADVRALAHLTGGGWEANLPRTLPDGLGAEIDTGSWVVPPIFTLIQQRGDISDEEMVRTFNLGIGMTAVVPSKAVDAALEALPEARLIGRVARTGDGAPRVRFA
jgi:phosphoribosylformylglycinamidine cyclo-ligase